MVLTFFLAHLVYILVELLILRWQKVDALPIILAENWPGPTEC